jgi:magnesium-transporting ATPase (P-type)
VGRPAGAARPQSAHLHRDDRPDKNLTADDRPSRPVAGSTLEDGRLRIAATQVGADTTTARIARLIQESLGKQSETQRLADRLADQRVYFTLVTGGLVYAVTRDLTRSASRCRGGPTSRGPPRISCSWMTGGQRRPP